MRAKESTPQARMCAPSGACWSHSADDGEIRKKRHMRGFVWVAPLFLTIWAGCSASRGVPGVSVTPRQALDMWRATPEKVNILDVRTSAEYVFVGHAPMARNIPVTVLAEKWDAKERKPAMTTNPKFVDEARKHYKSDDLIVTMCGNGERGAEAARILKAAGFTNVLNMEGGFDGEHDKDCAGCGVGKLIKPGWRDCGLVWTWSVDREFFHAAE